MIRIIKNAAPDHLIRRGNIQIAEDHQEYNSNASDYASGIKKFEAKSSIYNSEHVKKELVSLQNGKCCYCETKDVRSNSDVEHYRPKKAYSSTVGGSSNYPGYFWLAYDWDNLFLSCQVCNQIFKNDFFPIVDEATRAQNNGLSIANEEPIIIHPSIDIPENEIGYRESIPYGITDRGQKTIEYLGFGKVDDSKNYSEKQIARIKILVENRKAYYEQMKLFYDIVQIFSQKNNLTEDEEGIINDAKTKLYEAQFSKAEWSLMIKNALQNNFKTY